MILWPSSDGTTDDTINLLIYMTKAQISLKRKKIFQNRKCHSSWFWNVFQISFSYFLLHRHFTWAGWQMQIENKQMKLTWFFITWALLFVCSIGCSFILIAGNWAFCSSKKYAKTATVFLTCFNTKTVLQNLELKWGQYHISPIKMMLLCGRLMLYYVKILYS